MKIGAVLQTLYLQTSACSLRALSGWRFATLHHHPIQNKQPRFVQSPGSNWHELVFPDDITTFYFAEVVAPDGTEMYIGPGEDYDLAFEGVVPEGTELFITGEQEGMDGSMWGFALYGETMGWIRVEDVEELDLPGMDLIDPDGHSQGGSSSGTYEKIKLRKTVSQTDGGNEADALPWAVPLLIAAIVVLIASSIALAVVIGKNRRN